MRLGCCISTHGFGRAARAVAILQELSARMPIHCTVVSAVPSWFFRNSLSCPFSYYPWQTDVGLVQQWALHEDIPATVRALAEFIRSGMRRLSGLPASLPAATWFSAISRRWELRRPGRPESPRCCRTEPASAQLSWHPWQRSRGAGIETTAGRARRILTISLIPGKLPNCKSGY